MKRTSKAFTDLFRKYKMEKAFLKIKMFEYARGITL
jgi:hypothetical protein